MKTQEIVWTALPNGRSSTSTTTLKLSVHISPRLGGDEGLPMPMLSLYPDFLDWPSHKITYNVFLGHQSDPSGTLPYGPFPATIVTNPASVSSLYKGLFKPLTYVRPHAFQSDLADQVIVHSYPVRHVRNFIKGVYTSLVANHATSAPPVGVLTQTNAFGPAVLEDSDEAGFGVDPTVLTAIQTYRANELTQRRANAYLPPGSGGVINPNGGTDNDLHTDALVQMEAFHQPRAGTNVVPIIRPVQSQALTEALDFHRMVSLAGGHPTLLRYLGLVVDLTFTPTGISFTAAQDWVVKVVPTFATPLQLPTTNLTPLTRLVFDSTHFLAAPRPSDPDLVSGGLAFNDSTRFEVIEVDHDGAALKALEFGRQLVRFQPNFHGTDDTPQAHHPPSLRSGGLSVARVGAAQRLVDLTLKRASALDGSVRSGPVYLDAEDITTGYAIHVFDSLTKKWNSLGKRVVSYNFVDLGVQKTAHDEATVTLAPTSSVTGSPPDLYQQETIFVWNGWSLAAQRPGKTVVNHPVPAGSPPTARIDSTADQDFRVQIRAQVEPGTLPRLRFGATYQIRARAVDLAGNVSPSGSATAADPNATGPITYRRFEPVQAPLLLLRRPRTEGESVERMVIRSNSLTAPSGANDQRHLSPPKIHEMMAEQHGLFDVATVLSTTAFPIIQAREDANYETSAQGTLDPNDLGQTRYFDVDSVTVPFLCDPLARGVALMGLPGTPAGSIFQLSFNPTGTTWPAYRTVRLVLQEGTAAPALSPDGSVLTVSMPKGTTATVTYGCYVNQADLALLGVWGWLDPTTQAAQLTSATRGQLWALTPPRTLTLVHAVRQPLFAPVIAAGLAAHRSLGQTFTELHGTTTFSAQSTSHVNILASWPEAIDGGPNSLNDPSLAGAHPIRTAHAFDIPDRTILAATTDQLALDADPNHPGESRHHFGDTKYRLVSYSAVATTRFTEYFVQRKSVVLTGVASTVVDAAGFAAGTVRLTAADGTAYSLGTDFTVNEAAGSVARVATGRILSGATVNVAYVTPVITQKGGPVITPVPSTARPDAPKVLYIVPAWQRTAVDSASGTTVTHKGGSLRVYLDRPWWSSGDGELLGVVIWPAPTTTGGPPVAPPPEMAGLVTRWGQDPLQSGLPTSNLPVLEGFTNRVVEAPVLHTLHELGDTNPAVYVAGHTVAFDPIRKLWFCDIDVDPGHSYFPFVRLALARYQPNSVTDPVTHADVHLSRVVMADFIQLTPDRSVTVATTANPTVFQLSVLGLSYQMTREANLQTTVNGPSVITAWVEQRSEQFTGELGWDKVPNSQVNLTPQAQPSGDTLWTGSVQIPQRQWPFRVVLEEYEQLSTDDPSAPSPAAPFITGQRLVYTEIVHLTSEKVGIITANPGTVSPGPVLVGQESPPVTITITNEGAAPFATGAAQITGPDAAAFSLVNDTASNRTYQPGDVNTVQVEFEPGRTGGFSAQLHVPSTNAVGSPATVNLAGMGVQPAGQVTPAAMNFGTVTSGSTSAPQIATVANVGTAPLHVSSVSVTGAASSFLLSKNLAGSVIPPGSSVSVNVTFKPTSTGAKGAQIVVTTDGPGSPFQIALTGVGG